MEWTNSSHTFYRDLLSIKLKVVQDVSNHKSHQKFVQGLLDTVDQ